MAKFNVGDRVEVLQRDGEYKRGDKGTVVKANKPECVAVKMDTNTRGGHSCLGLCKNGYGWYWSEDDLKLTERQQYKSIHITQKDNTVHAVYKNGDDIIRRSEAKCHPDDEFDFEIGAKLAFERLEFVDEKNVTPKEEKMVFDKYKFIELRGLYGFKGYKKNSSWVDKSHGKSRDESEFLLENEFMVKESEWCE